MTGIWPCVRTWNPSIGAAHACHCVPSAPARNRLLASAMNQTKLPFPAGARFLWPATVEPGDTARRREWSGHFPNTAPFHKASSRRYGAGKRPIETVSLQYRVRRLQRRLSTRLPPPVPENAERDAFLLRLRQPRYGLSNAAPDGPGKSPSLAMPRIPLLRHGNEIDLRHRNLPGKEGGHGSEARDSRCPTPVYPMPIRTAPTVNLVAPDATRQGRNLSSLLHFVRHLPSPSRRNAHAADPESSAVGEHFRTYRRSPSLRKARLFSSPGTPAGGSHPSPATLARGPGTRAEMKKK